jgi:hypothetical protein
MHPAIQTSTQIIAGSVFGSAFVHELHGEDRHYFAPSEGRDLVIDFAEILRALRAAFSLRSK